MITETVTNPETGEVFTNREWDCVLAPEKNQPGAHGLNLLTDCEALLSEPDLLSRDEKKFVEYVVRTRLKTRRYLPGHLIAMLTDAQAAQIKVICLRSRALMNSKHGRA